MIALASACRLLAHPVEEFRQLGCAAQLFDGGIKGSERAVGVRGMSMLLSVRPDLGRIPLVYQSPPEEFNVTQQTKPQAYSYLRFSHPTQAEGDSIRRQTELRDGWLARNNVSLNTDLVLEDRAASAFRGAHRKDADRHALAAFLDLVRQGRIPKGSYLIVENLDRLSREGGWPALTLLGSLIEADIRVVQLLPFEMVYDNTGGIPQLMSAIMEFGRGNSESKMKSERVGRAWKQKKQQAAEHRTPLTAWGPGWLRLVEGKWVVLEEAAKVVRDIFAWTIEGHGIAVILKRLNGAGITTFRLGRHWSKSTVCSVLRSKSVIGEYQPHVGRKKDRRPEGDPIPNYYPAVITEDVFYAAQMALDSRHWKGGQHPKHRINLFAGRLFDARDGSSLIQRDKGDRKGGRVLAGNNASRGVEGSRYVSFPFEVFEKAILACLKEIDPRELYPKPNGGRNKVMSLSGRLAEKNARIEEIKAKLLNPKIKLDSLVEVLGTLEEERRILAEELARARQEEATPLDAAWGECKSLIDVLETASNQEEARTRLRSAISRTVESIWCLFVAKGVRRAAVVQIFFTGGKRRDYVIGLVGGHKNVYVRREPWWEVASMRAVPEYAPMADLRQMKVNRALRLQVMEQNVVGYVLEGVMDLDRYRAGKKGRWIIPPDWIVTLMRIFEYVDPGDLEVHRCQPTS
jgi:DNA invertase Pin-like site-specific DNA recombinase